MAVFHRNSALVEQNGILHNCETKSCAANFARAAFIYTVETLKQAIDMLLAHSYAIVGKSEAIIIGCFFIEADEYIASARIGD